MIAIVAALGMGTSMAEAQARGVCSIRGKDQAVIDRQECTVTKVGADEVYTWPKGTKTVVRRDAAAAQLNGAPAQAASGPKGSDCLTSTKSGNTFCFEKGSAPRAAAAPVAGSGGEAKPTALPVAPKAKLAVMAETAPAAAAVPPLPSSEADKMMAFERELGGHDKEIYAVGISGNGKVLMTGGEDNLLRAWSLPDGKMLAQHKQEWGSSGNKVVLSHDGGSFAYISERAISVRETISGKVISEVTQKGSPDILGFDHYKFVNAAFLPSGQAFGIGKDSHTLFVWDIIGKKLIKTLKWLPQGNFVGTEYSVQLMPDGKTLLGACEYCKGNPIKIWNIATGEITSDVKAPLGKLPVAFSHDGRKAALANESSVTVVELPSGRILNKLSGQHVTTVGAIAFSPDGKRLASNDGAGVVNFWNLETGRHLQKTFEPKRRHFGSWRKLVFTPDGARLAIAGVTTGSSGKGELNRIQIYNVAPDRVAKLEGERAHAEEEKRKIEQAQREEAARQAEGKRQEEARLAEERAKLSELREAALAARKCDEVKRLDGLIKSGDRHDECVSETLIASGSARDLYLEAGKHERSGNRDRARRLYTAIVDKHANDDLALKATDSLSAMARAEGIERSNANAAASAARSQQETQDAVQRANREASDRERQARSEHCRGLSPCLSSCSSLPYGNSRDHCWGQCRSRFSGC